MGALQAQRAGRGTPHESRASFSGLTQAIGLEVRNVMADWKVTEMATPMTVEVVER